MNDFSVYLTFECLFVRFLILVPQHSTMYWLLPVNLKIDILLLLFTLFLASVTSAYIYISLKFSNQMSSVSFFSLYMYRIHNKNNGPRIEKKNEWINKWIFTLFFSRHWKSHQGKKWICHWNSMEIISDVGSARFWQDMKPIANITIIYTKILDVVRRSFSTV